MHNYKSIFSAKNLHIHLSLYALLLLIVFLVAIIGVKSDILAEGTATNSCSTSEYYLAQPQTGDVLSGEEEVKLFIDSSLASNVSDVEFKVHKTDTNTVQVLGSATRSEDNQNLWTFSWDTTTLSDGSYNLKSIIHLNPSTESTVNTCILDPIYIEIDNGVIAEQPQPSLRVVVNPNKWVGVTNVIYRFAARVFLEYDDQEPVEVTGNSSYTWHTTIGSINSSGSKADFYSGPNSGVGKVKVIASYSGMSEVAVAEVIVESSSAEISYPSTTDTDETSGDIDTDNDTKTNTAPTKEQVEGDSKLNECLKEQLGNQAYDEIFINKQRPNFAQLKKIKACFAERKFVLPVNLAPVEPTQLDEIKETKEVKIAKVENTPVPNTFGQGIKFSGKALPNSEVLVYIFSEPLVVTVSADKNGDWTYTLENPLEPGEHTAYVVTQDESGEYVRSSNFAFAIAQAAPSEVNPNGYSLALAQPASDNSMFVYIFSAVGLILLASVVLTRAVWFKNNSQSINPVLSSSELTSRQPIGEPEKTDAKDTEQ